MLFTRGVNSPGSQHPLSPCQFTSTPSVQMTEAKHSSLQSCSPPTQQPALPLGKRPSSSQIENPPEPTSPNTNFTLAPVTPYKTIKDILWDFNPCRTDSFEIQIFSEVSTQDYETLANLVENWYFPHRKPRLSHHPISGLLVVEMPTPAHEFIITDFRRALTLALDSLPINRRYLRVALESNLTMRSTCTGFVATPDLALVSTSTGNIRSRNLFAVVECAFSQDHDNLMQKIRDEVQGWPEIEFVVAIFVSEAHDYISPSPDSPTWRYFAQHEAALSSDHFLSLAPSVDESTPSAPVEHNFNTGSPEPLVISPIIIAGHTWCEIRDIQYCVWVKKDGLLDLDRHSAIGFLYPGIEMADVELAINNGLSAVKSRIVEIAAKTNHSVSEPHKLQEAELSVTFDWSLLQSTAKMAAEQTASSRYEDWFYKSIRGTKFSHSDDS